MIMPALEVPREVLAVHDRLRSQGKRAWIVGGCVRDALLGRPVSDWDLATDARPEELLMAFPRAIPTGIEHGTVTVRMGSLPVEITTLRGEGAYSDGRRPDEVRFVDDIAADLGRRDFTINAIAVDPETRAIIDPYGGQNDLAARVIRAVGDPRARFSEDGLRVLRAARFTATLEMDLDPETFAAIEPTLDTYRKVSQERVRDEWVKTMKARHPSRAFDVMQRSGILHITCPELELGIGMVQNKYHAYDVWRHGMECMDGCSGDPILRIAALLHDVGKPKSRAYSEKTKDYTFYDHDRLGAEIADPICQRLRFSNDERARVTDLVRHHIFHYGEEWSDATVRRWIRRVGVDRIEDLYRLNEADVRAKGKEVSADLSALEALKAHVKKVIEAGAALSTKDLEVDGHDLMRELSLRAGPILGQTLHHLLDLVTHEPGLNNAPDLLARAREFVAETENGGTKTRGGKDEKA
jgi:tRNA nucleotidyltransferase (CCA-adding enzyme)